MTEDDRRGGERRTQPVRAPGAGSLTPVQSVAASNPCLNCGTNVQLEFCPECGQREIDVDPSVRELVQEIAGEFLHWDGKLFATLRLLFAKPGELTQEYLAGRRVRFISPLRLYLACSVLYFFCSSFAPEPQLTIKTTVSGTRNGVQVNPTDTAVVRAELDSMAARRTGITGLWGKKFVLATRDGAKLSRDVLNAIPKAMFVLLPMFAAILALVFRDRRRKYPQHLVFALHAHAMIFLGMIVMLIGRFPAAAFVGAPLNLLVVGLLGAYLFVAANRVYGGAKAGTLARLTVAFSLYAASCIATMMAVFAIVVLAG